MARVIYNPTTTWWARCALLLLMLAVQSCDDDNVCGTGYRSYEARESFRYAIALADRTSLRIAGINGSIDIDAAADADSVRIWGEKVVKSKSTDDAWDHMDDLSVVVNSNQGEVYVRTEQPTGECLPGYEVQYHASIPATWQVDASTVNGSILVDSVAADVDVEVTNGGITLLDLTRNTTAVVVNGGISAHVDLPAAGSCVLTTTNGGIDLAIPTSTSAELSARVVNGTIIVSGLELTNRITTSVSTTGILGAGDGQIVLRTTNGSINVVGF
jgi:hypothetical protein